MSNLRSRIERLVSKIGEHEMNDRKTYLLVADERHTEEQLRDWLKAEGHTPAETDWLVSIVGYRPAGDDSPTRPISWFGNPGPLGYTTARA